MPGDQAPSSPEEEAKQEFQSIKADLESRGIHLSFPEDLYIKLNAFDRRFASSLKALAKDILFGPKKK